MATRLGRHGLQFLTLHGGLQTYNFITSLACVPVSRRSERVRLRARATLYALVRRRSLSNTEERPHDRVLRGRTPRCLSLAISQSDTSQEYALFDDVTILGAWVGYGCKFVHVSGYQLQRARSLSVPCTRMVRYARCIELCLVSYRLKCWIRSASRDMSINTRTHVEYILQPAAEDIADAVLFFNTIYADQKGWIEVLYAVDPACQTLERVSWFYYEAGSAVSLATKCLQLAATYGNIYVSSTAYRQKERARKHALPSRIIFLDDAPPGDDYTMVVQTSLQSRHAYYLTDKPLSITERAEQQQRAAIAVGADRSGADIEQLVRVPGTQNTKYGAPQPVKLIHHSQTFYTLAQLDARWPAVPAELQIGKLPIDRALVEYYRGNIRALVDERGIPKRCNGAKNHTRQILEGKVQKRSGSERHYAVARGLRLVGYPLEAVAAILLECCDYGRSNRSGSKALWKNVVACLEDAWARYPDQVTRDVPINNPRPPRPLDLERPARQGGARKKLTADGLLTYYRANIAAGNRVLMSVTNVAANLSLSKKTIKRREYELRQRGLIERITTTNRQQGMVVLLDERESLVSNGTSQSDDMLDDGANIQRDVGSEFHEGLGQNSSRVSITDPTLQGVLMPYNGMSLLSLGTHPPVLPQTSYLASDPLLPSGPVRQIKASSTPVHDDGNQTTQRQDVVPSKMCSRVSGREEARCEIDEPVSSADCVATCASIACEPAQAGSPSSDDVDAHLPVDPVPDQADRTQEHGSHTLVSDLNVQGGCHDNPETGVREGSVDTARFAAAIRKAREAAESQACQALDDNAWDSDVEAHVEAALSASDFPEARLRVATMRDPQRRREWRAYVERYAVWAHEQEHDVQCHDMFPETTRRGVGVQGGEAAS
jgi:hypothetical protein